MSAPKCCATRAFVFSSGHSGNRHRYGRAGRAGLPVIPDHGGEVHVGDQYRRAGRGDNVSLYRATSHVPVIQRSVDVFVCNRLYHLASARFGLGCAFQEGRLGARGAVKLSVVFTSLLVKAASNQYTHRVRVTDAAQQCDARRL